MAPPGLGQSITPRRRARLSGHARGDPIFFMFALDDRSPPIGGCVAPSKRGEEMTNRRDGKTVLVIEQDDEIRYSLTLMLMERGYGALCVPTPQKALELLDQGMRPSVIVFDPFTPNDARAFQ